MTPRRGTQSTETHRPWKPTGLQWVLIAAACFYALFIIRTAFRVGGDLYFTLIDDAMVSMRYARHFAEGYGLTWNIGARPIEGFTNLGWMLLMTAVHLFSLPLSKTSLVVMVAAAAALLGNTIVVYRVCEELSPGSRYAAPIAAMITAFYFPLVFWSLRGMEVGVLSLLVDLALLLSLRLAQDDRWRTYTLIGAVLAVALAVRMDAILQACLLLAYMLGHKKANLSKTGIAAGMVALTLAAILVFQHSYFGDFFPNTYYQKVAGTSASERIKNGLLAFAQYATRDTLMLALAAAAGILLYRNMRSRETALLAALFLVQCAYSVWVGGDYAEPEVSAANRFISQGMPPLIVLFSLVAGRVMQDLVAAGARAPGQRARVPAYVPTLVAFAVVIVISGQPWMMWGIDNAPLLKADIRRVKVGVSIAENTSGTATIAVHAAGQIPYYSDRPTVDLLGLNDPIVAKGPLAGPFYPGHDKWNYDYSIMQLKPDLIADNWIKLGDYMRGKGEYEQLDNGMYVRRNSNLVNITGLLQPIR